MDYHRRFGLEFNPFIKNIHKDILIETTEYKETVFRLNHLLSMKGFGLITGEPGRGKTTIIRSWAAALNPSSYKVIYISLSTITVIEFYKQLALELGMTPQFRKVDNFKLIQEAVNRLVLEKRCTPIIILDEANYMNSAILNDLKILFNFDMDSKDRAVILLVGLPLINNTLRLNSHEPLRQRIVMNYHLDSLDKNDTRLYITDKLKKAGAYSEIFNPNAIESIINSTNGNPRLLNKLCNTCLLIGSVDEVSLIDADIVMKAVDEMELG